MLAKADKSLYSVIFNKSILWRAASASDQNMQRPIYNYNSLMLESCLASRRLRPLTADL